jgi:hypothetical protein
VVVVVVVDGGPYDDRRTDAGENPPDRPFT